MRIFSVFFILASTLIILAAPKAHAQSIRLPEILPNPPSATDAATLASEAARLASQSAEEQQRLEQIRQEDVTKPEEGEQREEVFELFRIRPAEQLSPTNFMAYGVQYAVGVGVPARTIMLILLLPFLATIIAFFRHVIGLPTIGMLVPIALSITLISTGLTAGLILLATIIFASVLARLILKPVRIMQMPKLALSVLVVSIFVIAVLTLTASIGLLTVKQLSIFPILLLILLSERIIALQYNRSPREALPITLVTFGLGLLGFGLLSSNLLRNIILLYPELILLLIPLNIIIGRYFGLRFSEYFRFNSTIQHGSK